ncbi:MAG: hypothetical protein HZA17_07695 [Nitrospirae bacterium]|nr:hypothetical protein [Nitrospirota bacterium]
MEHENGKKEKKPYEKPRLRIIKLAAEEVLTTGCKTAFADPKGVAGSGCLTGVCSMNLGS